MPRRITMKHGQGIIADKKKQQAAQRNKAAQEYANQYAAETAKSVIEHSTLEDLIATVQLRKEMYADETGEAEFAQQGPTLVSVAGIAEAEHRAACKREFVSIPRRPKWHESMSAEELTTLESETFIEWRRALALAAQEEGLHLTPYERNLDFWRQLWRCIERSDLLVQIVDARDPHFYYCQDLQKYAEEIGGSKRLVLLVNKADFLSADQRKAWLQHFQEHDIDAIFFSALREVQRQHRKINPIATSKKDPTLAEANPVATAKTDPTLADVIALPVPGLDSSDDELESGKNSQASAEEEASGEEETTDNEDDEQVAPPFGFLPDDALDVVDSTMLLDELLDRLPKIQNNEQCNEPQRRGTVGFVGYPNVGKSTVINALVGSKKVGMSGTPGKTKHIQTLELTNFGVTFCDCPGLVFPSVVATRSHLVISNTVPLDDLPECFSPVSLIVEKVGWDRLLEKYACSAFVHDAAARSGDHVLDAAHSFLAAFAVSRNHFLRVGVPDENWAARKVLRDYVTGELLHCEPPPMAAKSASSNIVVDSCEGDNINNERSMTPTGGDDEGCADDFGDLDAFIEESAQPAGRRMTKRRERYLRKQMLKGGAVSSK